MKKFALLLCFALLLPAFCLIAGAADYGSETQKLVITHINEAPTYEGAGIIYSQSSDGTLGGHGSFDWWRAVSFAWDEASGCYTVAEIMSETGVAKSTMQIPENGFVYCVNLGNNWPELYAQDPVTYAAYADSPDYTNAHTEASFNYVAELKVGDKVYIYGVDTVNSAISTNGALWYSDDFESDAFIKIGSEESGKTAYNPERSSIIKPAFNFGINAVNTTVNEGQAMLLTPAFGDTVIANGNNYSWCKVAVFDWSAEDGAYVLVSVDNSVGSGMNKNAVIPKNGFAVAVNLGNNYPALGDTTKPNYVNTTSTYVYENIGSVEIGTKVYLVGIDLENSSFEYEGNIAEYYSSDFVTKGFIKVCEDKPEGAYEPDTQKMLAAPEFVNTDDIYTIGDIEIEWNAVDGASEYYAAVFNSTVNTTGISLVSAKTSETSVALSASDLTVGSKYTAYVYAIGADGASSPMAEYNFVVCSERALNSVFRDMKVVAFGDSITAWTGWVSMMYGELGCEVVNAGVGGDRTTHALARIDKDVIAEDPDLTIINFGMNDQAVDTATKTNLTPIDQYEANYRTIIDKVLATGSKIILVAVHDVYTPKYGNGSPDYNEVDENGVTYVDRYNEVVKKLAEEYKLGFLDINTLAEDMLDEIILDGIHLNDAGQAQYCEWISDYCYEYAETAFVEDTATEESSEASAEDSSDNADASSDSMPASQIAIIAGVMFVVIAVIGVMFIKVVMKNKR